MLRFCRPITTTATICIIFYPLLTIQNGGMPQLPLGVLGGIRLPRACGNPRTPCGNPPRILRKKPTPNSDNIMMP